MTNWSPEKRNQVILLVLGTVGVMALIWYMLIASLQDRLKAGEMKRDRTRQQLNITETGARTADQNLAALRRSQLEIEGLESRMAYGDLYRWVRNNMQELQKRHDVRIIGCDLPQVGELDVPPQVPYQVVNYGVSGSAHFDSFGVFLADFENTFQFARLRSLALQAGGPGLSAGSEPERLAFRIDFMNLVRTNAPAPQP